MKRTFLKCVAGACLLTLAALTAAAQTGAKNGEWTSYGAEVFLMSSTRPCLGMRARIPDFAPRRREA